MEFDRLKLMIPGPVQPDDDVLEIMGQPVQPHYGPIWVGLYADTTSMLAKVFNTQGDVFLIAGSGSAGIDACIGSAVARGQKVVIGINGFFGDRLKAIAESYHLQVIPVIADWGRPLDPQDFDRILTQHPDVALVAVVHVETSTTIVNPIVELGEIIRQRGSYFFVDAVSSLGGLPMSMDAWKIDLCASASQKCLGAPPGLSPVAIGPRGWEAIDRNPDKGHGWYLNLRVWRQYSIEWADWHPFPVTLPTNNILALRASLQGLFREGIECRMERYRALALRLRQGLRRINMPPYTPDELMAPVVTGAYGPPGIPTSDIIDYMAAVHKIKIAGGMGELLKDKIFRIGHMSPTVSIWDIDDLVEKLGQFEGWKALSGL